VRTEGKGIPTLIAEGNYKAVVSGLLNVAGLNYGALPEQKLTVIAEWLVFHISGNCISAWFLFGESDIIIYAITFGKSIDFFGNQ